MLHASMCLSVHKWVIDEQHTFNSTIIIITCKIQYTTTTKFWFIIYERIITIVIISSVVVQLFSKKDFSAFLFLGEWIPWLKQEQHTHPHNTTNITSKKKRTCSSDKRETQKSVMQNDFEEKLSFKQVKPDLDKNFSRSDTYFFLWNLPKRFLFWRSLASPYHPA